MSSVKIKYGALSKSEELKSTDSLGNKHQQCTRKAKNWVNPIDSNVSHIKAINSRDSRKSSLPVQKSKSWNEENSTKSFGNHLKTNNRPSNYNCVQKHAIEKNAVENKTSKTPQSNYQYGHKNVNRSEVMGNESEDVKNSKSAVLEHHSECDLHDKTNQNEEDSDSIATNLEEKRRLRRERLKMKKELKKQEKAILREEEVRKKRLAPKDQKITIIDHSTLNRILEKETSLPLTEPKEGVYNGSEFPALGEVTSPARMSSNKYQKKNEYKRGKQNQRKDSSCETQMLPKSSEGTKQTMPINCIEQNMNSKICSSRNVKDVSRSKSREKSANIEAPKSSEEPNIIKTVEDKGKRPKIRDPIQLNINDIIKINETKHEVTVKQHVSKPMPKTDVVRYAGNILDSDNPERKRGKQREVPKAKKPSSLKQIILQERLRRKEVRLQETLIHTNKTKNLVDNLSNESNICNSDDKIMFNEQEVSDSEIQNKSILGKENKPIPLTETMEKLSSECVDSKNERPINVQLESISVAVKGNCIKNNEFQEIKESQHEHKISEMNLGKIGNIKVGSDAVALELNCQSFTVHQSNKISTPKMHSRKFREYCDHCITPDILNFTSALLEDVVKFHDRQFARSPLKASAKRRHITGLKEVRRFLTLRRVRLLVIAPDLESIPSSGGLDDIVTQLKDTAIANEIPYIFALGRRQLGYVLKKKVPVSCVGILNYDGTEQNFHQLMTAVDKAREEYKLQIMNVAPSPLIDTTDTNQVEESPKVEVDVNKEVVASLLAKLSTPRNTDSPTPFLQAIERVNTLKWETNDEIEEE